MKQTIKTWIVFCVVLSVCMGVAYSSTGQTYPQHSASQVLPGMFASGGYTFPQNLVVSQILSVTGQLNPLGGVYLGINSDKLSFMPGTGWNFIRSYNSENEDGHAFGTRYPIIMQLISTGALEVENHLGTDLFAVRGSDGRAFIAGNVGIGTTSPAQKLHVAGNVRIGGSAAPYLTYAADAGAYPWWHTQNDQGTLKFSTGATPGTALMTLLSNGNIGIGTTAPAKKLDVNGDVNVGGTIFVNNVYNKDTGSAGSSHLFLHADARVDTRIIALVKDNMAAGDIAFDVETYPSWAHLFDVYKNGDVKIKNNIKTGGNRFDATAIDGTDYYWFRVNGESDTNTVMGIYSSATGTGKKVLVNGDLYIGGTGDGNKACRKDGTNCPNAGGCVVVTASTPCPSSYPNVGGYYGSSGTMATGFPNTWWTCEVGICDEWNSARACCYKSPASTIETSTCDCDTTICNQFGMTDGNQGNQYTYTRNCYGGPETQGGYFYMGRAQKMCCK